MASQMTLAVALVALLAVNVASAYGPFGYGAGLGGLGEHSV